MSLKIDVNRAGVAHHITDGPFTFPYAIDAHEAAKRHPLEWKMEAWTAIEIAAALAERDQANMPAPLAPLPLSPAEQEAYDEYTAAVVEATARLKAFREGLPQVEKDEATVASVPPIARPVATKPESMAQRRKRIATEA